MSRSQQTVQGGAGAGAGVEENNGAGLTLKQAFPDRWEILKRNVAADMGDKWDEQLLSICVQSYRDEIEKADKVRARGLQLCWYVRQGAKNAFFNMLLTMDELCRVNDIDGNTELITLISMVRIEWLDDLYSKVILPNYVDIELNKGIVSRDDLRIEEKHPLYWAVVCNQVERVKSLLKRLDECAYIPLSAFLLMAARCGHVQIVDLLIANGVDVNEKTAIFDGTPLNESARNGHLEVVKRLIAAKASINHPGCMSHITPLYRAVSAGQIEVINTLIAEGANIHIKVLYKSMEQGDIEVLKTLLSYQPECVNEENFRTIFMVAIDNKSDDVIKALIEFSYNGLSGEDKRQLSSLMAECEGKISLEEREKEQSTDSKPAVIINEMKITVSPRLFAFFRLKKNLDYMVNNELFDLFPEDKLRSCLNFFSNQTRFVCRGRDLMLLRDMRRIAKDCNELSSDNNNGVSTAPAARLG